MKNFPLAALTTWFAIAASSSSPIPVTAQTAPAQEGRKPVVVELFTSEGCSTCPPADVLLQQLQQKQPVAGAEIIALEEHVDYWNHDGWIDPYSSPDWTHRQQEYVALDKKDEYTPELVVNGASQFLGSDANQAESQIEQAAKSERTQVAITSAKPEGKGSQRFTVTVGKLAASKPGDSAEVWIAVTEDGLHSSVSLGENAGHVLNHTATLRSLRKIGVADASAAQASFNGESVVKLNGHWNPNNIRVVVFVQEKKSREILGAASTKLKN